METKCSYQTIHEYISEINKHLKNNGISDFSKYKVNIKDDKLFFDKWEYSNIEKPNITIQNINNYQDIYQRIIYLDISIRPIPPHVIINARGQIGLDNINEEEIIGINGIDLGINDYGYLTERNQIISSKFRLHNGLMLTSSEIQKSDITNNNFNGQIRIIILYKKN